LKNKLRNEKLANYFYDLSKYAGTIVVIGRFINTDIPLLSFLGGMIICILFAFLGYFLTPKIENNLKKD